MPINLVKGPVTPEMIAEGISEATRLQKTGAHSVFIGEVRDDMIEGKRVAAIEYSAYEEMVNKEAETIKGEILGEFSDVRNVVLIHSAGIVRSGEISLFVVVSAYHRSQAMEACRKTVEKIKSRLPVWKKEIFGDNTHRWK